MLFEKPGKTPRFRYTTAFTSETQFLAKENVNDETGSKEGSRDGRRRRQIPG